MEDILLSDMTNDHMVDSLYYSYLSAEKEGRIVNRVDFNMDRRRYPVIFIQDKPFLFSDIRIKRSTIPNGLWAYDIAEEPNSCGKIAKVKFIVLSNYFGTVIGKYELDFGDDTAYFPMVGSEERMGMWLDKTLTFDEYMNGRYITDGCTDFKAFMISS